MGVDSERAQEEKVGSERGLRKSVATNGGHRDGGVVGTHNVGLLMFFILQKSMVSP